VEKKTLTQGQSKLVVLPRLQVSTYHCYMWTIYI